MNLKTIDEIYFDGGNTVFPEIKEPVATLSAANMGMLKHMLETVASRRAAAMEQCVKTILSQLLGREPELEDAKDLNLIQLPVKNPMGDVTYHVEYGEGRVFLGVMVVTRDAATFNPVMPTGEKPTGTPNVSRLARRKMARKIAMQ